MIFCAQLKNLYLIYLCKKKVIVREIYSNMTRKNHLKFKKVHMS